MFRNNLLWAVNVYYRKEIKVIYYTLPGCSHWDMPPTHETGGKRTKSLQEENEKKMKMNPDCWWFMVIMVTLYPLLLWLLVISLLSAYCIFFIWLHSTSDLHSIHFQAAGILQVFIFLLFNLRNIYSWWNVSDNLGKSSKKIKLWTISHPSRPTPSVKKKCVLNDSK